MNAQQQQPRMVELLDRAHNSLMQARDHIEHADLAMQRADQAIGELARELADLSLLVE
jgi:hypothetical protein